MKKLLTIGLSFGLAVSAWANGGTHYSENVLNPTVRSLGITNTVGVTNILANAVLTNGLGCNTNYNVGGILYSNAGSISGVGQLIQTIASGLCSGTSFINGSNSTSGLYYTNDPTLFFLDATVPSDGFARPLTNCSFVVEGAALTSSASSTNIEFVIAPIYTGDLNQPTTSVETVSTFRYVMAVTASSTARFVIGKPLGSIVSGSAWDGVKGFRVISAATTNTAGSYVIYNIRITGFNPMP